jgi:hypothetical protein
MCSVLLVDLNSLGILKPLPYLVMFAMSNVGGWLGDALILQGKHSVAAARKTVNTIGERPNLSSSTIGKSCSPSLTSARLCAAGLAGRVAEGEAQALPCMLQLRCVCVAVTSSNQ